MRKICNLSKEYLNNLYWGQNFNTYEIGDLTGFVQGTIQRRMEKLGIPRRQRASFPKGDANPIHKRDINGENNPMYGVHLSGEKASNYSGIDKLIEKFVKENRGKHKCQCGCEQKVIIQEHHYYYGIPKYCYNHHSKKENNCFFDKHFYEKTNGNWRGGKSFEPYPLGWNKTFKEQIRYRDGYKCQLCGCPEIENGRKLDVHHIDYDKENLNPSNLVSLCQNCHGRTNGHRDYWKEYLKKIIKDKEVSKWH